MRGGWGWVDMISVGGRGREWMVGWGMDGFDFVVSNARRRYGREG